MRVVADTNVLISALMFGRLQGQFLGLAFAGAYVLVTSPTLRCAQNDKHKKCAACFGDRALSTCRLHLRYCFL
jgi:predicted nucleic acid-binding protein